MVQANQANPWATQETFSSNWDLGLGTCRDRMKLGKKIIWKMLNRDFKDLQEMQVNIEKIKMVKIAKKKKKALKEEKMKEKKKKKRGHGCGPLKPCASLSNGCGLSCSLSLSCSLRCLTNKHDI
jgi:hypothetical protein